LVKHQNVFLTTDNIEIVIADNCSEDHTLEVVKKYSDKYSEKVMYFRNEINIGADKNLEKALSFATGSFLKLHNDNLLLKKGALAKITDIIIKNIEEKPLIFFPNGNADVREAVCRDLNEFVSHVSYFSTWIGGFGIWQEDLKKIPDFSRNYKLQLVQADVLFQFMAMKKKCAVYNENYFICMPAGNKIPYNIAEIFGQNYLSLYKKYLNSGLLEKKVFEKEKKRVLINHIIPHYFKFKKSGFFCFMKDYKHNWYFYPAIIFSPLLIIKSKFKKIRNTFGIAKFFCFSCTSLARRLFSSVFKIPLKLFNRFLWRIRNPHNETFPTHIFDHKKVSVGKRTYGELTVHMYGNPDEQLVIGNYVSIASNVIFLLGGNHSYESFSTYPFLVKLLEQKYEAATKGAVIVEDDVWIGTNSLILSGVKLGKGSVIAAGSIVTKDVPAYGIVGGNPAKLIKYRFEQEVISELFNLDFSRLNDEILIANKDILYQKLTKNNVKSIVDKLR